MSSSIAERGPYASVGARDRALRLGMWVFVGSETLLFAVLFGAYAAYRAVYSDEFAAAAAENQVWVGTLNTLVLIVSSFFVAWAVELLRHDRPRAAMRAVAATMALGGVFLALKTYEYSGHLAHGIAPGVHYHFHELPTFGAQTFFTLYYLMTGLHALHVIAGLVVLGWMLVRVRRGRLTAERYVALELGALYWHLVDVVWIFLWPLLYLTA
jgi:cytochrome c oxidase subunit 3